MNNHKTATLLASFTLLLLLSACQNAQPQSVQETLNKNANANLLNPNAPQQQNQKNMKLNDQIAIDEQQKTQQNQAQLENYKAEPDQSDPEENMTDTTNKPKQWDNPPEMQIETNRKYNVTLNTSAGAINLELDPTQTPQTVNNFVFLANQNFYDGVIFHRTIDGFMIQGGDPTGTGAGGPGYRFDDEPFNGEYKRGVVAMANAGPNTNGSQFFIMHKDYPLPPNYVIFGQVTSGLEVVDQIATAPTKPGGEGSSPVNPVTIDSVTVN